jgi:hypothetical protein
MDKHEIQRYLDLGDKLNMSGIRFDLDCPCDRAIVDAVLSRSEALELLSLHDQLQEFGLDEVTRRRSVRRMEAV